MIFCFRHSKENTKEQVKIQICIKKVKKEYIQEAISLLSLPVNPDALIHMLRRVPQVIVAVVQYSVAQDVKKNLKLQVVFLMEDEARDDGKM